MFLCDVVCPTYLGNSSCTRWRGVYTFHGFSLDSHPDLFWGKWLSDLIRLECPKIPLNYRFLGAPSLHSEGNRIYHECFAL